MLRDKIAANHSAFKSSKGAILMPELAIQVQSSPVQETPPHGKAMSYNAS